MGPSGAFRPEPHSSQSRGGESVGGGESITAQEHQLTVPASGQRSPDPQEGLWLEGRNNGGSHFNELNVLAGLASGEPAEYYKIWTLKLFPKKDV